MGGGGGTEPVPGDLPDKAVGFGGGVAEVVDGERAAPGVAEEPQDPAVLNLLLGANSIENKFWLEFWLDKSKVT